MPPTNGRSQALVAFPLAAGLASGGGLVPVHEIIAGDSNVTLRAGITKNIEISVRTYSMDLPMKSVIPLTTSTFIPQPSAATEEDFLDVDFGEPEPFFVPSSWLSEFRGYDPRGGEKGTIEGGLE